LLVEVVVTVEDPLNLPGWFDTFVIVILAIGFPVALVLSWAFDITPDGIRPASRDASASVPQHSFLALSQVLVLAAVGFLVANQFLWQPGETLRAGPDGVVRYQYNLKDAERLVPIRGVSLDVSADGRRIVYVGHDDEDGKQLWIRERNAAHGRPLPGTEDALQPFFSPDAEAVAYVSDNGQLRVVSLASNELRTLVDEGLRFVGGDWSDSDHIYFTTAEGLMRVSAKGGIAELVVAHNDDNQDELGYGWPDVIETANKIAFVIARNHEPYQIALADLRSGEREVLFEGTLARFVDPDLLIHARGDGALQATRLNLETGSTAGETVLLGSFLRLGTPDMALSANGRFVYATRPQLTLEVVWVDRDGSWSSVDPDDPILSMRYAALSPDNSMLALSSRDRPFGDDGQVWVKHLPGGPLAKLTYDGNVNMRPAWHPDGRSVLFISDRGDNRDIWIKRADGAAEAERLVDYALDVDEALYSSDGRWLVHRRGSQNGTRDIMAIRPEHNTELWPLLDSEFDEAAPALSPDDRWLAYVSFREGMIDVYVRPFPASDQEVQISSGGGTEPVWSPSTRELFYRDGNGNLVSVQYGDGDTFVVESRTVLFDASAYSGNPFHPTYDVAQDAQRFVMVRLSDSISLDEDLNVVENWLDEVALALPAN